MGENVRVSSRLLRTVLVEVVDVCLAWVFLADSLSGLWCWFLVLDLGRVLDIGISNETAGGNRSLVPSIDYCWGAWHISVLETYT